MVSNLAAVSVALCPPPEPILVLSLRSHHHIASAATTPTQNARRPYGPSRPLRWVLYAQQRENGSHAFSDWRGRAAHVRPDFVDG